MSFHSILYLEKESMGLIKSSWNALFPKKAWPQFLKEKWFLKNCMTVLSPDKWPKKLYEKNLMKMMIISTCVLLCELHVFWLSHNIYEIINRNFSQSFQRQWKDKFSKVWSHQSDVRNWKCFPWKGTRFKEKFSPRRGMIVDFVAC